MSDKLQFVDVVETGFFQKSAADVSSLISRVSGWKPLIQGCGDGAGCVYPSRPHPIPRETERKAIKLLELAKVRQQCQVFVSSHEAAIDDESVREKERRQNWVASCG